MNYEHLLMFIAIRSTRKPWEPQLKTTIFMLLNATPAWLRLTQPARRAFLSDVVGPILAAHPATRTRYYDVEAFTGRCSDLAVFETEDLKDYADLVDALRDTAFFSAPYYEVVDILPGIENGYRDNVARLLAAES